FPDCSAGTGSQPASADPSSSRRRPGPVRASRQGLGGARQATAESRQAQDAQRSAGHQMTMKRLLAICLTALGLWNSSMPSVARAQAVAPEIVELARALKNDPDLI